MFKPVSFCILAYGPCTKW